MITRYLVCISLAFFNGCTPATKQSDLLENEPSLKKIHVDESLSSETLKLSEIMDVEKIVLLETRQGINISEARYIRIVVSNRYILVITDKEIFQFDLEGKFIRTLATRGNGPAEFSGIHGYAVDREKEVSYYSDANDIGDASDLAVIAVIDLHTGKYLSKVPLPLEALGNVGGMYLSDLNVRDDHSIVCSVPSHFVCDFSVFAITPDGDLLGGMARHKDYKVTYGVLTYYSQVGGEYYYKQPHNDTLYVLQNWSKKSYAFFDIEDFHESVKEKDHHGNVANETAWSILQEGRNYFVIRRIARHKYPEGGTSPLRGEPVFVKFNEPAVLLKDVFIDSLGFEYPDLSISKSGQDLIFKLNADEFKTLAKKVLKKGSADPEVVMRLKKLDLQISENDNPILIMGKTK